MAQQRQSRFLQVAHLSLGQTFWFGFLKADLNGHVTVSLQRLLLSHETGASLDDCHGNDFAFLVENLAHSNFSSQNTLHDYIPLQHHLS